MTKAEKFLIFLEDREVKDSFIAQLTPDKLYYKAKLQRAAPKNISDYLLHTTPEEFICSAFMWCNTKEGFHFWSEVEDEWHIIIRV